MPTVRRSNPALGPLQLSTLRRPREQQGMITAWWSDVPGTRIPVHVHHFPETRWVLSGDLRVTADGEVHDLGPGDRLDLPAKTPHASEVVGLSPVVYVTGTTERSAEAAGVRR